MSIQTTLMVKNIQVCLKELRLYQGKVDGIWGEMTAKGLSLLCGNFNNWKHKGNRKIAVIPGSGVQPGMLVLQRNMSVLDLCKGSVDGVWDEELETGFRALVNIYRDVCLTETYDIAWSNKVPQAFVKKVKAWVLKKGYFQGADSALMACIAFETGGTFSPTIQNGAGAKAFGLIQFMAGAAKDLGVPLDTIRGMDQLTQLDLVFKYFEMWEKRGKRFKRLEDFYLTIFYPAAVGMLPDQVLFKKDIIQYRQNSGFDFNKDGCITIGEISSRLYDKYYEGMELHNRKVLA